VRAELDGSLQQASQHVVSLRAGQDHTGNVHGQVNIATGPRQGRDGFRPRAYGSLETPSIDFEVGLGAGKYVP